MKLSELTEGTHIHARGRVWAITLIQPQDNGELRIFLAAAGDGPFRAHDIADLIGLPDEEVEVVPTTITLACPLCEDAQIEDTDHVEQVTAPTREAARKLLVDHILNTDNDVAHDDVNVAEYLVKHHT